MKQPYYFMVRRGLWYGRVEWVESMDRWVLEIEGSAPWLLVDLRRLPPGVSICNAGGSERGGK